MYIYKNYELEHYEIEYMNMKLYELDHYQNEIISYEYEIA